MKVYIVRRGESETNKTSCWTGWLDAPLTERGIEDARRAGEQLFGRSFDKVYSSDLIRARKTAEIALPGCDPELSPLLREIRLGDLEGRPLTDLTPEMREAHPEGYADFGGEDLSELKERVKAFLSILEGDAESCESIAVFSHGGWLKSALSTVLGVNVPSAKLICQNCAMLVLEYKNGTWLIHSWINL